MNLEKEFGNIFLIISSIILVLVLILFINPNFSGFAIYNQYNYTGNETAYEIITPNNFDKILTSSKGVINYDIIDKGDGSSRFNWKSDNGFIAICNSEICDIINETTVNSWYLTHNISEINIGKKDSVISWINEEIKTKREFWTSFEDIPKNENGKKGDEDFNDVFFRIQKKKDILLINLVHQESSYTNPSNIQFHFDSQTWFVTYKISKHIYLGKNKWNDSNEQIYTSTGDLEYNLIYDDSKEGQWVKFEFNNITDIGDFDNDTIINENDNCLNIYNPDQKNYDNDTFGDLCDNCPFITNQDQLDSNNNGIGDVCEATCNDSIQNGDEEGIDCGGSCDPCIYTRTIEFNQENDTLVNNVKATFVTTKNITNTLFNNKIKLGNNVVSEENLSIINIQPDYDISDVLLWMFLEINYNDSEIINQNINESTIKLYYYNNSWIELNSSVNIENNYLSLNLTYLINEFGLFGDKNNILIPTTPSGSGGSSGGSSSGSGKTPKPIETRVLEKSTEINSVKTEDTTRILEKKIDLCNNGKKDSDETGIDCGGSCKKCISILTILPYSNYMLFILLLLVIMTLLKKVRKE
ncbi:MAG: hypothetical protein PHF86_05410 [Candidatus Nanoarchaeia archaeon]|nr:hypothetical protein [Candidatus Nanoarchaeia archaeon]